MFSKAIVRLPCARFAEGLTTVEMGAPNYALALQQHSAYCDALEKCGLTVTRLAPDEGYPDSTFVEDTAVITKRCVVLTKPGAASRAGEVERIAKVLSGFCQELHSIREPGTLDGGDVCEAEDRFFIGISERTNEAGAHQLAELLFPYGYASSFVDIRGLKNILHLKSGIAHLDGNRMVVIDALADHEAFSGYDRVRVEAKEQYAANCVQVNDRVLVAAGFPVFDRTLRDLGYNTLPIEMTEFEKMDGGLSCLSLRF